MLTHVLLGTRAKALGGLAVTASPHQPIDAVSGRSFDATQGSSQLESWICVVLDRPCPALGRTGACRGLAAAHHRR
jgi:hypothetical protein